MRGIDALFKTAYCGYCDIDEDSEMSEALLATGLIRSATTNEKHEAQIYLSNSYGSCELTIDIGGMWPFETRINYCPICGKDLRR